MYYGMDWEVRSCFFYDEDKTAIRRELHRRLRSLMPGFPLTPMPHGKYHGHLWDYFSAEGKCSETEWWSRLRSARKWYIVPEVASESSYQLIAAREWDEMPRADIYLWSPELPDLVLALDHEQEGPWCIEPGRAKMQVWKEASPKFRMVVPSATKVDSKEASLTRVQVRRALRKSWIYVPRYRLCRNGPSKDHLWNYLPRQFDVATSPGSFAYETLMRTETVLCWSDLCDDAWFITEGKAEALSTLHDTYYLEWPAKRWLLAMPGNKILRGEDSDHEASFVVFGDRV